MSVGAVRVRKPAVDRQDTPHIGQRLTALLDRYRRHARVRNQNDTVHNQQSLHNEPPPDSSERSALDHAGEDAAYVPAQRRR